MIKSIVSIIPISTPPFTDKHIKVLCNTPLLTKPIYGKCQGLSPICYRQEKETEKECDGSLFISILLYHYLLKCQELWGNLE